MRRTRGVRWLVAPFAVLALVAAGCGDDDAEEGADGGETTEVTEPAPDGIVVGAGINDPEDETIAVLEFLPEDITIEAGTDVTWEWNGGEPHSVTFIPEGQPVPNVEEDPAAAEPAPPTGPIDGTTYVSSGLQPLGGAPTPFEGTFETPGTYEYVCIIHPNMIGTVEVVEAGDEADTPADVAERRAEETEQYLEEGREAKADLVEAEPVQTEKDDGTTEWTIEMGTTTEHVDVLAFVPTPAEVQAGDTITFVNNSFAPHTASFFGTGAPEDLVSPFDPRTAQPTGESGHPIAAAGFYNTGVLPPNAAAPGSDPPPIQARTFSFTVPNPGTYEYVCIFHAPSKMVGTIEVT